MNTRTHRSVVATSLLREIDEKVPRKAAAIKRVLGVQNDPIMRHFSQKTQAMIDKELVSGLKALFITYIADSLKSMGQDAHDLDFDSHTILDKDKTVKLLTKRMSGILKHVGLPTDAHFWSGESLPTAPDDGDLRSIVTALLTALR
jgi:hypothetical protein